MLKRYNLNINFTYLGYSMMDLTLKTQPRKKLRLSALNYKTKGYYFVTICSKNRNCLFGEICENKMSLNSAGQMIKSSLNSVQNLYFGWSIDTQIIMPNHIHAIFFLFQHSTLSLPEVIRNFKAYTTSRYIAGVYEHNWPAFSKQLWQRSYYEHIIRNEISLHKVREYIINNPAKWKEDRDNPNR